MRSTVLVLAGLLSCAACSSSDDGGSHSTTTKEGADSGAPASVEDTRACETSTLAGGTFDFEFEGVKYQYLVHLPPSYDGSKRTPLVLNWHGYTSTADQQALFSGMNVVADENDFILVYPNSPDNSWNAGACCAFTAPQRNDVGFARALVEKVSGDACVDSKRIYSTGMSNGGFMSHRLACEAADSIAAVAPVAGNVGIPDCQPSRPIAILDFHGTADGLVDYATGGLLGNPTPGATSIPDTLQAWAGRDGCDADSEVTYQQGTVTCQTWSGCDAGVTATLCTAEGEGHCWPGTAFCPFGAFTTDIDASREIAAFFKKFKLP